MNHFLCSPLDLSICRVRWGDGIVVKRVEGKITVVVPSVSMGMRDMVHLDWGIRCGEIDRVVVNW